MYRIQNLRYVLPLVASLYSGCNLSCDNREAREDNRFVVSRQNAGSEVLPVGYIHKPNVQKNRPKGHIIAVCTPEDVERSAERLKRIEENYRYSYPDASLEQRTEDH